MPEPADRPNSDIGSSYDRITLAEVALKFSSSGKNYAIDVDFSDYGLFSDSLIDAKLYASDRSFVITPNLNQSDSGAAGWTVIIPTSVAANSGTQIAARFNCEVFGRGWSGLRRALVPGKWTGPNVFSWGNVALPHYDPPPATPYGPRAIRIWTALEESPMLDPRGIGIGVITYNRRDILIECVKSIAKFTETPYFLVVADDGSPDGSAAWARESGIPVVTGRNWGVARNKNRALAYLMRETQCDTFILIEEDCHPETLGWEKDWIEAAQRYPQMNYTSAFIHEMHAPVRGSGTLADPYWSRIQSAQVTSLRREVVEKFGYLDPRFGKWGDEHLEWSYRVFGKKDHDDGVLWPGMDTGVRCVDVESSYSPEILARSRAVWQRIKDDPPYRHPFHTGIEQCFLTEAEHEHEIRRAQWSLSPESGKTGLVSIIVPTRSRALAQRLYDSIFPKENCEFIWVWNGVGKFDVPGKIVEYERRPFSYEEAVNRGVMASDGEILWIVNDDVVVTTDDVIKKLVSIYSRYPYLAVANSGRSDRNGRGKQFEYRMDPHAPSSVGCCWTMRRKAFCQMGGLEESLTAYGGDEVVTAVRMSRLGWEGAKVYGFTCEHKMSTTYGPGVFSFVDSLMQTGNALGWKMNPTNNWRLNEDIRTVMEDESERMSDYWMRQRAKPISAIETTAEKRQAGTVITA